MWHVVYSRFLMGERTLCGYIGLRQGVAKPPSDGRELDPSEPRSESIRFHDRLRSQGGPSGSPVSQADASGWNAGHGPARTVSAYSPDTLVRRVTDLPRIPPYHLNSPPRERPTEGRFPARRGAIRHSDDDGSMRRRWKLPMKERQRRAGRCDRGNRSNGS